MKKYEIAFHNYAEAKRAQQVQKYLSKPCKWHCALDQNSNIQWYFHAFKVQESSKSG